MLRSAWGKGDRNFNFCSTDKVHNVPTVFSNNKILYFIVAKKKRYNYYIIAT